MVNLTYVDMLAINELSLKDELLIRLHAEEGLRKLQVILPDLRMVKDEIRNDFLNKFLDKVSEGFCLTVVCLEGMDHDLKTQKVFVIDPTSKEHVLVRIK